MEKHTFSTAGFRPFLADVAKYNSNLQSTIQSFLDGNTLSQQANEDLYRLLGIYTKKRYGEEAIALLEEFVTYDTAMVIGRPQHENPDMIALGKLIGEKAKAFGLVFKNVDNRVFEVTLPGQDEDLVGFHAHADIVPVNKSLWVLDDGTQLEPLKVTTIGNRMYGRGTEDDKNGIVVSLFAMKVIKEEQLPVRQTLRLIVDTTEETSGTAIPYYMKRRPMPPYNLALDGSYPVVIAEKGYGTVMASFPVRKTDTDAQSPQIIGMTGGLATNQIPAAATLTFSGGNLSKLEKKVRKLAKRFTKKYGAKHTDGQFHIETQQTDDTLVVTFKGVSAHSSQPDTGINPVSRIFLFVDTYHKALGISENEYTDAAQYASDNWGLDFYGKELGIDFSHDFMGPMTASQTYIGTDGKTLKTAVNIRMPAGKTADELKNELAQKLVTWQGKHGEIKITIEHSQAEPMYRSPEGKWVNNLLDIAAENLNIERKFGSSNGATSAHNLPNGVQFGLSMPNEKYTGHNANEFKTIDQFLLDLQIVTETFIRIGNLDSME
ncbi:dipeptidase [Marinibactrum halimedae]|uniref:Dipeptidase n=2 Tax=Marinibactrum halimedae TaxID=1444977 RepID=A0AA37T3I9_9GAMM|nr:dipeptidase [Marinibactrum halimedae]